MAAHLCFHLFRFIFLCSTEDFYLSKSLFHVSVRTSWQMLCETPQGLVVNPALMIKSFTHHSLAFLPFQRARKRQDCAGILRDRGPPVPGVGSGAPLDVD